MNTQTTSSWWQPSELKFLLCPVSARQLSLGALRHRSVQSIQRQRQIRRIKSTNPGRASSRLFLYDFPGVDWNAPAEVLAAKTGCGLSTVARLKKEAAKAGLTHRPHRTGRRSFTASDFPGVDWSLSISKLKKLTGLSNVTVIRIRRELQCKE